MYFDLPSKPHDSLYHIKEYMESHIRLDNDRISIPCAYPIFYFAWKSNTSSWSLSIICDCCIIGCVSLHILSDDLTWYTFCNCCIIWIWLSAMTKGNTGYSHLDYSCWFSLPGDFSRLSWDSCCSLWTSNADITYIMVQSWPSGNHAPAYRLDSSYSAPTIHILQSLMGWRRKMPPLGFLPMNMDIPSSPWYLDLCIYW